MNTEDKIKVMQAFLKGKTIQVKSIEYNSDWEDIADTNWNWDDYEYRVKPEPEYRPYKDTDEMIEDYKVRSKCPFDLNMFPCIWVRNKANKAKYYITGFTENLVQWQGTLKSLDILFEEYTYPDGSPIGKIVD